MTDWNKRSPPNLSKALSIPEQDIKVALNSFPGLFTKSRKVSRKTGAYFYTLQIRHARQWLNDALDEEDEVKKPPLETEYLTALLNHIVHQSSEERGRNNKIWVAVIAGSCAFGSALVSAGIGALVVLFVKASAGA